MKENCKIVLETYLVSCHEKNTKDMEYEPRHSQEARFILKHIQIKVGNLRVYFLRNRFQSKTFFPRMKYRAVEPTFAPVHSEIGKREEKKTSEPAQKEVRSILQQKRTTALFGRKLSQRNALE